VNHFPNTDFYITTNASLIDSNFMDFVKQKNIHITFSLDGDEKCMFENRKTSL
jgi:sulfatase maturation enzyme AslB (radical SAM superfamily)